MPLYHTNIPYHIYLVFSRAFNESQGVQNVTGRVGLGIVQILTGRVKRFSNFGGRVRSGQEFFKSRGSNRVESRFFQISRVGSGRVKKGEKTHGSGQAMTHEKRVTRGSGQHDPRVVFG